ncbi:hypothetical protein HK26_03435 [Acetobacter okinawensis]|uniref:Uncharacterized protein n=1 Tax=Acetobacter okinawensis TaxID=1076594 RepID=A0A252BTP6_9PROT|nr:hypothetical protein HK26_03435 [Acetobacter okinawensis]
MEPWGAGGGLAALARVVCVGGVPGVMLGLCGCMWRGPGYKGAARRSVWQGWHTVFSVTVRAVGIKNIG